jgi:hypothetical protein
MLRKSQIADVLSFIVVGVCLYFMLPELVTWSLLGTGSLCWEALTWTMPLGGPAFNFVHGLIALGCVCLVMITAADRIKQSVRWLLRVER